MYVCVFFSLGLRSAIKMHLNGVLTRYIAWLKIQRASVRLHKGVIKNIDNSQSLETLLGLLICYILTMLYAASICFP